MRRRILVFAVAAAIVAVGAAGAVPATRRTPTATTTADTAARPTVGVDAGMPGDMPGMNMGGSHMDSTPVGDANDPAHERGPGRPPVHSGSEEMSHLAGGSAYGGAGAGPVASGTRTAVLGVFGAGNLAVLVAAGTLRRRTARSRTRRRTARTGAAA